VKALQRQMGFAVLLITHDLPLLFEVADRIAVMKDGKVVQVGTPGDLYHRPATSFVADFIGQTNLIRGTVTAREAGRYIVRTAAGTIQAAVDGRAVDANDVVLSNRPEQVRVARGGAGGGNRLVGKSVETAFLGDASEHVLDVCGQRLRMVQTPPLFDAPAEMAVEFDPEDVVVLEQ
jgi:ABC-type Fe3+/spermidine/putrescine transport system ATPase subunit